MRKEVYPIRMEGSMPYAELTVYLHEHYQEIAVETRPLVLVCPGGAYAYTSEREADPLAAQFLAMGYHAAVYPTALTELAYSLALIRRNGEDWYVNPEQIIVLGCSAGGHLAASMGVFWKEEFLAGALGIRKEEQKLIRPDGMILCYPVITSGEFAHRGSFQNLLGARQEELSAKMSLENQVDKDTPPAFIWHTYEDGAVPVENSLLFVTALRRAGVPAEFHMYPKGSHGLALANRLTQNQDGNAAQPECTSWVGLAHTWIEHWYNL